MLLYLMRALTIKNSKKKLILQSNVSIFSKKSAKNNKLKPNVKLKAETKLSIILIVYLVQWVPSCLIWMIDSLCNCVPNDISTVTYWLTFTVALTDPILILSLNSNYR